MASLWKASFSFHSGGSVSVLQSGRLRLGAEGGSGPLPGTRARPRCRAWPLPVGALGPIGGCGGISPACPGRGCGARLLGCQSGCHPQQGDTATLAKWEHHPPALGFVGSRGLAWGPSDAPTAGRGRGESLQALLLELRGGSQVKPRGSFAPPMSNPISEKK